LVGDDNQAILDRIKLLLDGEFQVVGAAENGASLINQAVQLRPDIVVMDVCIPGCGGVNAVLELKRRVPDTKLVFMSMIQSTGLCEDVMAAGALGYVLKERASTDLLAAVREALAGRRYVSSQAVDTV
jgi:DNA-binding NarL/FixJ family response regulator